MKKANIPTALLTLPLVISMALGGCGGGGGGDSSPEESSNPTPEQNSGEGEGADGVDEDGGSGDTSNPIKDDDDNTNPSDDDGSDDNTPTDSEADTNPSDPDDPADNETVPTEGNEISNKIWIGATCADYGDGSYFKTLYQFSSEGELLTGTQLFQDASCSTQVEGFTAPATNEYFSTTYAIGDSATLPDGTDGYEIHFEMVYADWDDWDDWDDSGCGAGESDSLPNNTQLTAVDSDEPPEPSEPPMPTDPDDSDYDDGDDEADDDWCDDPVDDGDFEDDDSEDDNETADGYFNFRDANTLCFSNNILIDTEVFDIDQGDGSSMDYEHCLSSHSLADEESPTPDPDPVDPVSDDFHNQLWFAHYLCYANDQGTESYKHVFEFTEDNRMIKSQVNYPTDDCSGDGALSDISTEDDGSYTDLGEETLSDGVTGHHIQITNPDVDPDNALDGYYVIDAESKLCVSYSLQINSAVNKSSTEIDYEHCMESLRW